MTQILPFAVESTQPGMLRASRQPPFSFLERKEKLSRAGRGRGRGPGPARAARRGGAGRQAGRARPGGAGAQRVQTRRPRRGGGRARRAPSGCSAAGTPAPRWPPLWRRETPHGTGFFFPSLTLNTSPFALCGTSCAELGTMTHPIYSGGDVVSRTRGLDELTKDARVERFRGPWQGAEQSGGPEGVKGATGAPQTQKQV